MKETTRAGSFPEHRLTALHGFERIYLAKFLAAAWIEEVPSDDGHRYRATELAEAELVLLTQDVALG